MEDFSVDTMRQAAAFCTSCVARREVCWEASQKGVVQLRQTVTGIQTTREEEVALCVNSFNSIYFVKPKITNWPLENLK